MPLRLPFVRGKSNTRLQTEGGGDHSMAEIVKVKDMASPQQEVLRPEEVLSPDCGGSEQRGFLPETELSVEERDGIAPLTKASKRRIFSRTTTTPNKLFGLGLERADTGDSRGLDAGGSSLARDHSVINRPVPCRPEPAREKSERKSRQTPLAAMRKLRRLLAFRRGSPSRSTFGLDEAAEEKWQPHEGLSRRMNYTPRRHGQTFGESYDLGEVLGGGGFAVVRDGTFKEDGEPCAIKVMDRRHVVGDLDALFHEVSILRSLQHHQIVRFIDFYEEPETFYLVLEKVTGGELFERVVLAGRFSEADARAFVRSLLVALSYCHSQNVAHRDIKPENILVASLDPDDRTIKLADFGLARSVANGRILSNLVGTPTYMAPEILRSKPHGTQVDCWGVGVVVHILLGGYAPFHSPKTDKLYSRIKRGRVDFDDKCWRAVSMKAKQFILALLRVNQNVRLTAAEALKHPWLQGNGEAANDGGNLCHSMTKLRIFNAKSKFRAAVNAFLAAQTLHSLIITPSQQVEAACGTETTAGLHAAVNTSSSPTSEAQTLTPSRGDLPDFGPQETGTGKSTTEEKSTGASDAAILSGEVAADASEPPETAISKETSSGAP